MERRSNRNAERTSAAAQPTLSRIPRPTMLMAQIRAQKTVSRLRFFSTTDDPASEDDTAPPNIEDRPPPLPRCSRISTISRMLVSTSSTLRTSSIIPSPALGGRRGHRALGNQPNRRRQPGRRSADTGGGEVVTAVGLHDQPVTQPLAGDQLNAGLGERHVGRRSGGR